MTQCWNVFRRLLLTWLSNRKIILSTSPRPGGYGSMLPHPSQPSKVGTSGHQTGTHLGCPPRTQMGVSWASNWVPSGHPRRGPCGTQLGPVLSPIWAFPVETHMGSPSGAHMGPSWDICMYIVYGSHTGFPSWDSHGHVQKAHMDFNWDLLPSLCRPLVPRESPPQKKQHIQFFFLNSYWVTSTAKALKTSAAVLSSLPSKLDGNGSYTAGKSEIPRMQQAPTTER